MEAIDAALLRVAVPLRRTIGVEEEGKEGTQPIPFGTPMALGSSASGSRAGFGVARGRRVHAPRRAIHR